MLAEVASKLPDPNAWQSIAWVAMTLLGILGALNQALSFWHKVMPRPSGAEALAQANTTFATKDELIRLEAEFKHYREQEATQAALRRKGIYDRLEQIRDKVLDEVKTVHGRADTLEKEMGAVQATVEHVGKQVGNLDVKLDGLEGRIITTLKNTGAI